MLRYVIAFLISLPTPSITQVPGNLARAEVNIGWRDQDVHVAGLTIRLLPGWKTYWRAPGDAGIPPSFNWSGSSNIKAVRVQFPVPEIMDQSGVRSIGYHGKVTFPLFITPQDPSAPIRLNGEISIGVCEEICVPYYLKVQAILPPGGLRDKALAVLLDDKPTKGPHLNCNIEPIEDGLRLSAQVMLPRMKGVEIAIIETGNPHIWVSEPLVTRSGGALTAVSELVGPSAEPFALARSEVRMTVLAGSRAFEMQGCD